jgi:hypothetical protein
MNLHSEAIPESLLQTIYEFDALFSEDRGSEMGAYFAEDARLQWPMLEDIVGREEIRLAFEQLVNTYTTISWKPDRSLGLLCDGKAVIVGRFVEDRRERKKGIRERVFGRIVEIWSAIEAGKWELELLMTSRYADTVYLHEDKTSD